MDRRCIPRLTGLLFIYVLWLFVVVTPASAADGLEREMKELLVPIVCMQTEGGRTEKQRNKRKIDVNR